MKAKQMKYQSDKVGWSLLLMTVNLLAGIFLALFAINRHVLYWFILGFCTFVINIYIILNISKIK